MEKRVLTASSREAVKIFKDTSKLWNKILFRNLHIFLDLPKILPELEHLKDKTIVTVCTGGIRCEKASGFLLKNNFADVYQPKDGIHTYMEKYPNQDFLDKLFVFDDRVTIGFNLDSSDHKIVGKCTKCASQSENLTDYYENGIRNYKIVCEECVREYSLVLK